MKKVITLLCVVSMMLSCFAMSFTGSAAIKYMDIPHEWFTYPMPQVDLEWAGKGFVLSSASGQPTESNIAFTIWFDGWDDNPDNKGIGTYPYMVIEMDPTAEATTALVGWAASGGAIQISETGKKCSDLTFVVIDLSDIPDDAMLLQVYLSDATGSQEVVVKDWYLCSEMPTQSRSAGGQQQQGDEPATGAESAVAVAVAAVTGAVALAIVSKKK